MADGSGKPERYFASTLDKFWEVSEQGEGVFLKDIPEGSVVVAKTANHTYTIAVIDAEKGVVAVESNGNYFRTPEVCCLNGSTFGGSMIKVRWIGEGMHLEFGLGGKRIMTTSAVTEFTVKNDPERAIRLIETAKRKEN